MPRIYRLEGDEYIPYDYCKRCWPKQKREALTQDDVDTDHPPYEETDYPCDNCSRNLGKKDNAI